MPNRVPEVARKLEAAFEGEQSKSRKYLRWVQIVAGVGLVYMALSIGMIYHLVSQNDELCAARQTSRAAYRTILTADPDWSNFQQQTLDKYLPAKVHC